MAVNKSLILQQIIIVLTLRQIKCNRKSRAHGQLGVRGHYSDY